MRRKKQKQTVRMNKLAILIAFFLLGVLILRVCQLGLSTKVDGVDLKKFASGRNTQRETLKASRGSILDRNGEVLSQNIVSYTTIAYLSPARSKNSKKTMHVEDKEMTAEKLAPVIGMEKEAILSLLNKDAYQVELGPGGRNITELKKEEIEALDLPGIDFTESTKRYYPNADFASYILGYAKNDEKGETIGELGIEYQFNDKLSGKDGYVEYQKDIMGYQIPNTPEVKIDAEEGQDIYLTIDSNIQIFAEHSVKDACAAYTPEWMMMVVADAKTGAILASSSCPSFDPNKRNIENYLNPLVSYEFEPGSTMKTYTYMAAMENNVYKGNELFDSGSYKIEEDTVNDWDRWGWGKLNFDQGFLMSSNVGVANLTEKYISRDKLKDYFKLLGFGSKTGLSLPREATGSLNFKYPMEVAAAGYGQNITTTAIQHIKALTALANNGYVLQPYLIDKIVDEDGKTTYKEEKKVLDKVASTETVEKMKDLMYQAVNGDTFISLSGKAATPTGTAFRMDGYDIIGKTGTAEIADTKNGGYLTGTFDYIRSFAGLFPKEDPEIIMYVAAKKPNGGTESISNATRDLIINIATYLNIYGTNEDKVLTNYTVESFINKKIDEVKGKLDRNHSNYLILGTGNKVTNQYPKKGSSVGINEKIILITNDNELKLPDLTGFSSRQVLELGKMLGIKVSTNGFGYVTSQSIPIGSVITKNMELTVELATKY